MTARRLTTFVNYSNADSYNESCYLPTYSEAVCSQPPVYCQSTPFGNNSNQSSGLLPPFTPTSNHLGGPLPSLCESNGPPPSYVRNYMVF